jgi:ubiquinone/menaquinone biosynthesis C-methylase UbiE
MDLGKPALLRNLSPHPDGGRALQNYRTLAAGYDATCTRIERLRWRVMDELRLQPGETVFDVACGTGPMLPVLADRVGPEGRVVGIELSPEMAAQARGRIANTPLERRITVAQTAVERFDADRRADALLFCYAHDVLQSPAAVARLVAVAKPGARVAMVGMKTLPWWWGWPVNVVNLYRARHYLTTYAGLSKPWHLLEARGAVLREVDTALFGSAYITVGRMPA